MHMTEIYSLDAVRVNILYLDQLRRLFTRWVHQNAAGNKNKKWEELQDASTRQDAPPSQRGTMIARCFLMMCRQKSLVPDLFNVELLHEFLQQTLPPITQGEIDFYEREELLRWANDENATSADEPMRDSKGEEMEPALQFHEFLFMLGLIAKRCITTSMKTQE
jgi:hypothetical protein